MTSQGMHKLKQSSQTNELAQKLTQDMNQKVSNVSNVRLSPPKAQQSPPQQASVIFQYNNSQATQPMQTSQPITPQPNQQQFQVQAGQAGVPNHHVVQQQTATPHQPPAQGTDEWHRQRRENHKEVERRRRETINEGINELQKIVPGCEKNKGSILARSVQYIQQLKDNETSNMEKWTLEKLLTDQAITELSQQVNVLKADNERLRVENERLKAAQAIAAAPEADNPPVGKRKRTDVEAGASKNS